MGAMEQKLDDHWTGEQPAFCVAIDAPVRECAVAKWFLENEFNIQAYCGKPYVGSELFAQLGFANSMPVNFESAYEAHAIFTNASALLRGVFDSSNLLGVIRQTVNWHENTNCPGMNNQESFLGELRKLHREVNVAQERLTVSVDASSANPQAIGVLGSTGAGKSTFINALLGSRIMETSFEICTAAVTEAHHISNAPDHPNCQNGDSCMSIHFLSVADFQSEFTAASEQVTSTLHSEKLAMGSLEDCKKHVSCKKEPFLTRELQEATNVNKKAKNKLTALKKHEQRAGTVKVVSGLSKLKAMTKASGSRGLSNLVKKVKIFTDLPWLPW
jgi:hypothetical protein